MYIILSILLLLAICTAADLYSMQGSLKSVNEELGRLYSSVGELRKFRAESTVLKEDQKELLRIIYRHKPHLNYDEYEKVMQSIRDLDLCDQTEFEKYYE